MNIYYTRKGKFKTNDATDVKDQEKFLHRDDGPAWTRYDAYGNLYFEIWYNDGILHNENGPAYKQYDDYGYCKCPAWFIHGIEKTREIEKWIKEKSLQNWRFWDDNTKLLFKLTWC